MFGEDKNTKKEIKKKDIVQQTLPLK